MSQERPKNIASSVHQRLINLARAQNADANLIFTRYGLERFLYRLSLSPHADSFVLKGAMLFFVWTGAASRPTRDLDLLAYLAAEPEEIRRVFQDICLTAVEEDALEFQAAAMQIEVTQGLRRFGGFRVTIPAFLGKVRLQVQVDLGFGDTVINGHLAQHNLSPKPYRWKAEGAVILEKTRRAREAQALVGL